MSNDRDGSPIEYIVVRIFMRAPDNMKILSDTRKTLMDMGWNIHSIEVLRGNYVYEFSTGIMTKKYKVKREKLLRKVYK